MANERTVVHLWIGMCINLGAAAVMAAIPRQVVNTREGSEDAKRHLPLPEEHV
jgi:hypothetical protein